MPEKYIIVLLCFDKDLYICVSLNLLIEKTMKKIILLLVVLCNCMICRSAGISKEVLTANTWKVVYPDFNGHQIHTLTFGTDNSLCWNINFVPLNKKHSCSYRYYLTDQKPSKFDKNQIGNAKSGRYLVFAHIKDIGKTNCNFVCYEEVSQDKNIIEFRDEDGQMWILEKQ